MWHGHVPLSFPILAAGYYNKLSKVPIQSARPIPKTVMQDYGDSNPILPHISSANTIIMKMRTAVILFSIVLPTLATPFRSQRPFAPAVPSEQDVLPVSSSNEDRDMIELLNKYAPVIKLSYAHLFALRCRS